MTPTVRWPALVLAAGYGTRLRPLSGVRAKAALPVAGRTLVLRVLDRLRAAGITRVVINLHHRAETITGLVGDGSSLGLDVRYSWEPTPLGSGGGPARALPLLAADRFFVVNADTLADVNLPALAAAHVESAAAATLAATRADLANYNALMADHTGQIIGVVARGTAVGDIPEGARAWHFVGVQAVSAAAFASVDPTRPSDTLRQIYPALWTGLPGSVRVFPSEGAFFDVGTPRDYYETVRRVAGAEGHSMDRGRACTIAQSARVVESILWDRVTVGEGAHLRHCIVADDVTVPPGVSYDRCAITRDAVIPF
ncbi:MAG: NDP-sugar synthase [Acidobacteriota bacterium]|nr:NDP-sugar synthase [Acidobacteriota bacterium]